MVGVVSLPAPRESRLQPANQGRTRYVTSFYLLLRWSALYRYQRPGSRAYSLPTKVGLGTSHPFTYYWGGRRCTATSAPGVAPTACQPRSDWVRYGLLLITEAVGVVPLPAPRESRLQPANQGRTGYVTSFYLLLRRSALYRYQRPGSRAYSLPTKVGLGTLRPFTYYWGGRRCIATSTPGVTPTACQPRSD